MKNLYKVNINAWFTVVFADDENQALQRALAIREWQTRNAEPIQEITIRCEGRNV